MELSAHLELSEMIRSERAKRLGISNMPTEEHLKNMKIWAKNIFEPIRNHFGRPIYLSSGYRSHALNIATPGSSSTSQHCTGEAGDIDMDGTEITNAEIFDFVRKNLDFDQLIWEFGNDKNPAWVHVSYEATEGVFQRKQILKGIKVNGVTKYLPYK